MITRFWLWWEKLSPFAKSFIIVAFWVGCFFPVFWEDQVGR